MLETLAMAPPDPILGLTAAFRQDSNPAKINLGVGVYKDENGLTPLFESVRRAQAQVETDETSKDYLDIDGSPAYATAVQALLLGPDHEAVTGQRAITAHTPGGTGALRLAGDFIHQLFPGARIWISDPTWANHPKVFQAAGLDVETYPYFDPTTNALALDPMLETLGRIPRGDVVLLHGCCHNPTGVDPTAADWQRIAAVIAERELLPLIDLAYQGLGDGLAEDTVGLHALCRPDTEVLVASSFSKNFGLYNERVGGLTAIASTAEAAEAARSHIKVCIRTNYSTPPAHGAAIATQILNDPELRALWEGEVAAMRDRINDMRQLFVATLKARGVERDFGFIQRQRGMFSFSGLNAQQVEQLRQQYAIYIVGSGRVNVAGMTPDNMDRLCSAIAALLQEA